MAKSNQKAVQEIIAIIEAYLPGSLINESSVRMDCMMNHNLAHYSSSVVYASLSAAEKQGLLSRASKRGYWERSVGYRVPEKPDTDIPYVIVRTFSAGVFAGYLQSRQGQEVILTRARRLWYWSGAASLSQLSVDGVKDPANCKFPCEVPSITLLQAIEILSVSANAQKSIAGVPVWQK